MEQQQQRTHKKARLDYEGGGDRLQVVPTTTMNQERHPIRLLFSTTTTTDQERHPLRPIVLPRRIKKKATVVSFKNLPDELRHDAEKALAIIQKEHSVAKYRHVSARLRSNKAFVLEAVKVDVWFFFMCASPELRNDRDVALEVVRRNGSALKYASEELRGDREIVLAALVVGRVSSHEVRHCILPFVPNHLQNDPMVAAAMVRAGGSLLMGSEIMDRLERVLLAARTLPQDLLDKVVGEESLLEFSKRWEHLVWHKIWLVLQLEPPGMEGTGRLFVELSGLAPSELQQVKELRYHCAPVIVALLSSFPGRDWKDLGSYPMHSRSMVSLYEEGSY